MPNLFAGPFIDPETGEDITAQVLEVLKSDVYAQRIRAMREQRMVARARQGVRMIRDHKGNLVAAPKAFISADYYHGVIAARKRENKYLRENDVNPWSDDDFLKHELKNNDALRPRLTRETRFYQISGKGREAPVFRPAFSLNRPDLIVR